MPDRGTDTSADTGLGGRTELRVHGVSGSKPEEVLDHPLLKQVAGDERAGFYRRWYPGGRSADLDAPRRLEAYRWGELTSGHAARAAWLLLLPFMLANIAHWMLPGRTPDAGRLARAAGPTAAAVLRLFALSLTLLFMLTAAQVAVDIAGWQCGGYSRCASSSSLLAPIRDGWLAGPGQRIVVAAVVPTAIVIGIGLLGRGHLRRRTQDHASAVPAGNRADLDDHRFWTGGPGVRWLRTAHVAAAAAGLAAVVTWPATTLAASGVNRLVGITLCLCALGVVLCAAGVVATVGVHRLPARAPALAVWSRRVALTLLALGAAFSVLDHGAWEHAGHLPGLRSAVTGTVGVSMALVLLLAGAVALRRPWRRTQDGFRAGMRGFGAPAVASGSLLVAAGFSAGLAYRVADVLGFPVIRQSTATEAIQRAETAIADDSLAFATRQAAAEAQTPLVLPPSFAWAGASATAIVVAVLVILGVAAIDRWRRVNRVAERIRAERNVPAGQHEHAVHRVATAVVLASLTDGIGKAVGRITMTAAVVVLFALAYYTAEPEGRRIIEEPPLSHVTSFGTWLMGALAVGLIWLAWQTARSNELRRTVGALWDIGSFWPRAAHPLAPPSYGERAVPELAGRMTALATSTADARVVVSGHSQGSILAAAAVLRLPDDVAARVALITHGSPLRRLYARFFPAYLGPDTLESLCRHVDGRWRNFYRDTDPVGSWVLDPPDAGAQRVDRRLLDPRELGEPVRGHDEYWDDPAYEPAVADVLSGQARHQR